MITCDLCKQKVDGSDHLIQLKERFKTKAIREVCNECLIQINKIVMEQREIKEKIEKDSVFAFYAKKLL